MRNKSCTILNYFEEKNVTIAVLQETWLKKCDLSVHSEINERGYKIISHTRDERRGGGLAFIFRPSLNVKRFSIKAKGIKYASFQTVCCKFASNGKQFKIINLYRPPYSKKNPYTIRHFLDEFSSFLSIFLELKGVLILCGDFNIDLLENNIYATEFLDILERLNLVQLIRNKTHVLGGLLDFVIIEKNLKHLLDSTEVVTDFKTDHYPIILQIQSHFSESRKIITKVREYHKCNVKFLCEDINNSVLGNSREFLHLSSNDSVLMYNFTLSNILNKHCPLVEKRYDTSRQTSPWYNSELQKLKQERRKKERQFKKHSSAINLHYLKEARNNYNSKLKQTRSQFYRERIEKSISNPKVLFRTLGRLQGTTKEKKLPNFGSEKVVANALADFYVDKISNIRKRLQSYKQAITPSSIRKSTRVCLDKFSKVSLIETQAILKSLKKKTSSQDPIPTSLVNLCFNKIAPIFMHIINQVIETSLFPKSLKHAFITPIIKDNSKDIDDVSNYRPVSTLSFMSKVLEKVISKQIDNHVTSNGLHATHQSAYKPFNSCETANIKIFGDIQENIHKGLNVALITLDCSSAFDTVDHLILINKLQEEYNIQGQAINLIRSYLGNRSFSVAVGKAVSNTKHLSCGVPQGSLLGPLLYLLYTNEIQSIVENCKIEIHSYADDIQLYLPFSSNNYENAILNLNTCLNHIKTWMENNCLKLNPEKTRLKIFGSNSTVERFSLYYNANLIKPTDQINVLGVCMNKNMKVVPFVSKKVQVCNFHIRNLYNIRKCLPFKSRVTLVTNLIISNLDYCNCLLICANKKEIRPLELCLNKAIRFIFGINRRTHLTAYKKALHILPVVFRIKFKACLVAFKIFNNFAPNYLTKIFPLFQHTETTKNLREGVCRDEMMFKVEIQKRDTIYSKIKSEWNKLPLNLRQNENLNSFKIGLKTYLFNQAFEE